MKVLFLLITLLVSHSLYALDATTLDNTGFESDIVNPGDEVTVIANNQLQPSISVVGPGMDISGKMREIGTGIYVYEFNPPASGSYQIHLGAQDESKDIKVDVN